MESNKISQLKKNYDTYNDIIKKISRHLDLNDAYQAEIFRYIELIDDRLKLAFNFINELPEYLLIELNDWQIKTNGDLTKYAPRIMVEGIIPNINTLKKEIITVYNNLREIMNRNDSLFNNITGNKLYRENLETLLGEATNNAKEVEKLKKSLALEIEEIKDSYKGNVAEFELITQEQMFKKASENYKKETIYWILAIVTILISILVTSMCFIKSSWDYQSFIINSKIQILDKNFQTLFYYDLIKRILLRAFILSILILILRFAIKNYNALMHNSAINLHKANCLAAVLRILNTYPDDTTRISLLQLAGKEIFTQQKTGYLSKDSSKIDMSVLEKLLSMVKGS